MEALIAVYKPSQISCNFFLHKLKHTYGVKKAGYSGTLDPFARGSLIVGFGSYTKLFPYISKSPKVYKATLWLGAKSPSLDTENVFYVKKVDHVEENKIRNILDSLKGEIVYTPPIYSAKKIQGKRAYELARLGMEVKLSQVKMQVFDIELLQYCHPYISFCASVSEGAYIRSIGEMIAKALGVDGVLCSLERVREGKFQAKVGKIENINPLSVLDYPIISDFSDEIRENLWLGRKFLLKNQRSGIYIANFEDFFSIIEVLEDKSIKYLLNRMNKNVNFIKKT
ncbi:tRNA pseudouridine(55) synthase TruB [Helicobacter sp. 11S03491-1]|uniref:tRNA pseudouridine(55) synthase TruB n=1 Tax=Helicobacter sp. 11S03491-1 TaxID=1476196 RepID=UPI000BA75870|nr:tRNA pseudouridine(55) synthase TruB [Helicobacter sp. 11S03491-1]PAF41695.1 tRNA pseudouridine(55) synthase TruB [Helicobacter sp. 11S03491-1]